MRSFILIEIAILLSVGVAQADDWPMFRHDLSHSGTSNEILEPPLELLWRYTTGGPISSSPAVSGGVVYVGSYKDNNVYAIDAVAGVLKWKYMMTGSIVDSSPAVTGGVVYVGSSDNNVYALDSTTGALKWKYMTGGWVYSSPTVSGGVVYVGSSDNNVYALDSATGALKWKYMTDDDYYSSPTVSGGVVYVGSWDNNVYALNSATGALKWKYMTGDWVLSSPIVSGGVVYVGSSDNNVYALDSATGALKWKYITGGRVISSPAISGGVVYVGSYEDNNLYALDSATGALKWKYTTGGSISSSPAISGGVVYVGSYDANVYAIDAATGALKWKYMTGGAVRSSPAISGGVVYVGSTDGNLYAFKPSNIPTPTPSLTSTTTLTTTSSANTGYKTLTPGESWEIGNGYVLTASSIDPKATPRQVWLVLSKDGVKLDDKILSEGETYNFNNIIITKIKRIWAGSVSDFAELTDSYTSIASTPEPTPKTTAPWSNRGSKVLTVGEIWDVGYGWTLSAQSIDSKASPRQVWLVLSKDGIKLDDKVLSEGQTYNFNDIFLTKINRIWAGPTSDLVELTDAVVNLASSPTPTPTTTPSPIMTPVPTETLILQTPEPQDKTYWINAIFSIFLISVIALLLHKLKKLSRIENFLLSIKKGDAIAIGLIIVSLFLIWYTSDSVEAVVFFAIIIGIVTGLVFGCAWVIRVCVRVIRNRNYITKISERFKKLIESETAYRPEPKEPPKKPAPEEKPLTLPMRMEYLQSKGIEKPTPEGKPRRNFKISWVILIMLLIVMGSIGYTVYQKYSPLAELANCGNNCIDYKKVQVAQYETPVPDIKITNADAEKLIMDVPIIIRNPSAKDTETVKIDFDVSMEGKHLTKGTIPAYELPAKQNTTILIKDVVIKYEELGDVLQKVAERHGAEMVREGKANISMTTDLLIYFPIELFSINIYTFTIPIQIESEVPVDMLKQNEEAKKQIEEKVSTAIKEVQEKIKDTLPAIPTKTVPSPTATLPQKTALPLPAPSNPQFP
ncbi:MAG: PQQ-binding-like beta-propeller repeat protein [Candidatus Methanoperedens sp.]